MPLSQLIDRNYYSVSLLEDLRQMAYWLQEREYYAVIDEQAQTIGIVTAKDLIRVQEYLAETDITKPAIRPDMQPEEVFKLMEESHSEYLPVYQNFQFIGVISLFAITRKLFETLSGKENKLGLSAYQGQ